MNNNLLLLTRTSMTHRAIFPTLAERGFAGMPPFGERHYGHHHKANRYSIFAGSAALARDSKPTKMKLKLIESRLRKSGGFYPDSFSIQGKRLLYTALGNFVAEAQALGKHVLAGSAKRIAYRQLVLCVSELRSLDTEIKAKFKKVNESELSPDKKTAEKEELKESYKAKADKVLHLIILLGEGVAHALPRAIDQEKAKGGKWVPSVLSVAREGIKWREKMIKRVEAKMAAEAMADTRALYAHGRRAKE